ncbi:MAG: c-type cytochrome [bacterium]
MRFFILFLAATVLGSEPLEAWTYDDHPAEKLFSELGCTVCHPGLPDKSDIIEKAPDLSHAGTRFSSAYLFDFLQNPKRVRFHIARAQMPNFHLSAKESLALTLFLERQTEISGVWPELPPELTTSEKKYRRDENSSRARKLLSRYECEKCHSLEGAAANESIDLKTVSYRLQRDWVKAYLAAPFVYDGLKTKMPSYYYEINYADLTYVEMIPDAAKKISIITEFLFSFENEKRTRLQQKYDAAKAAYPDITANLGEKIFLTLNCAACHKFSQQAGIPVKIAPDLSREGMRVKPSWLKAYLQKPDPIRPFGSFPGSGSRMPVFDLSRAEVDTLADYFISQNRRFSTASFTRRMLSAFSQAKAKKLLKEKLPCLGCHQLGSEGGKIAPNLSRLNSRLQDGYVYQVIRDPKSLHPETVMPKIPMPEKTLHLLVNYLVQQEEPLVEPAYLSPVDHAVYFSPEDTSGRGDYLKYCASCHGINGDSDGFNTGYLPKKPTKHSDAAYLSQRPDDTLFDGIFAGGYILNKSHTMPPWGQTLNENEIRQLVAYIRKLCQCEGPAWSRDNK